MSAHRPTWKGAIGGSEQGGNLVYVPTRQYSSRDMPSHLTLKTRQPGQGTVEEANKIDFKQQLLDKEKRLHPEEVKESIEPEKEVPEIEGSTEQQIDKEEENCRKALEAYLQECIAKREKESGVAVANSEGALTEAKRKKFCEEDEENPFLQDTDANWPTNNHDAKKKKVAKEEKEENSENDDQDDLDELMAEFNKIKKEREEDVKRKEAAKFEEEQKKQQEDILKGNPILNTTSYSLKKRWTEDTVFKNQAKVLGKDKKNRFINDTVRSDFHKKFLNKYVL